MTDDFLIFHFGNFIEDYMEGYDLLSMENAMHNIRSHQLLGIIPATYFAIKGTISIQLASKVRLTESKIASPPITVIPLKEDKKYYIESCKTLK